MTESELKQECLKLLKMMLTDWEKALEKTEELVHTVNDVRAAFNEIKRNNFKNFEDWYRNYFKRELS